MMEEPTQIFHAIPFHEELIDSLLTVPSYPNGVLVILAHGTTGTLHMPQLEVMARHLVAHGIHCLRFTDERQDLDQKIDVYYTVLKYVMSHKEHGCRHIYLGGRSLGARAAVGLANMIAGTDVGHMVNGVICLAYPLHPIDNKCDLRILPLSQLQLPGLIVNGDKDLYCDKKLMELQMSTLLSGRCIQLHWIEDADHIFRNGQQKLEDNIDKVIKIVIEWCAAQLDDVHFVPVRKMHFNIRKISPESVDSHS